MNKNVLIVLGGAVAVALVVAMLVQVTLGGKKKEEAVQEAKVEILVAAKDLSIGRELQDGDVKWQEWPQASVFPGAYTRSENQLAKDALKGRLARNIASGEPVMKSAMLGESKGNFVAASLQPGQRAVAIEVDASSMAGGFIDPGDFVDVILTYKDSVTANDEDSAAVKNMIELNLSNLATETILQNVKVLAVDQTAEKAGDDEKIKVAKTITLAVTIQDSEKLALAAQLGDLTLALRGIGDDQIVKKTWPTISDQRLTSMSDEIFTEYVKMKKDAGINSNIVRVYNGSQLEVIPAK